jgi:hypothetical protein
MCYLTTVAQWVRVRLVQRVLSIANGPHYITYYGLSRDEQEFILAPQYLVYHLLGYTVLVLIRCVLLLLILHVLYSRACSIALLPAGCIIYLP